jgi:DNA-binding beta-propeller fold protein YncE
MIQVFRRMQLLFFSLLVIVTVLITAADVRGMGMDFGGGGTTTGGGCPAPESPLVFKPGPLGSPLRIDWLSANKLLVTDYPSQQVFQVDGTDLSLMTPAFRMNGNPLGVAVAAGARASMIFVGNDTTRKVDIYVHQKNRFYRRNSFPRRGHVQPVEMVYAPGLNQLIIVDGLDGRIKFFSLKGRLLGSFDGSGNLTAPVGLAVDPATGEIAVSDYGDPAAGISASIEIFDYFGNHLRSITGSFSRPQGMVFREGSLFVADGLRGQILEFEGGTGNLKATHGCFGTGSGQLAMPLDVVYSAARNSLLVTDNKNGRVTEVPVAE